MPQICTILVRCSRSERVKEVHTGRDRVGWVGWVIRVMAERGRGREREGGVCGKKKRGGVGEGEWGTGYSQSLGTVSAQ